MRASWDELDTALAIELALKLTAGDEAMRKTCLRLSKLVKRSMRISLIKISKTSNARERIIVAMYDFLGSDPQSEDIKEAASG